VLVDLTLIPFLVGLFSAVHCLSMCGGIVGMLTAGLPREVREQPLRRSLYLFLYNAARIASYTAAGALTGAVGAQALHGLSPEFGHRMLQWLAGLLLLGIGLYLAGWFPQLARIERLGLPLWRRLEPLAQRILPVNSPAKALTFGALWGWFPCGLVYTTVFYATASGGGLVHGLLRRRDFAGHLRGRYDQWMVGTGHAQRGVTPGSGSDRHRHCPCDADSTRLAADLARFSDGNTPATPRGRPVNAHPTLIGQAPAFQAVIRAARLVAVTDATVLIQGESGTGKELLAQQIHRISRRASQPLVVVNCAALPENLVEAELFGYRRGAFTGAQQDYPGRIFLDEIGELPLSIQAKLLRFLEAGEVQGLGETRPRRVDVRVIAATNRHLEAQVREGGFREDLWYRLAIVPLTLPPLRLTLPPLRERREDILPLAHHFLATFSQRHDLPAPTLDRSAERRLLDHPWPGNVRELRNLCERLVILLPGQTVGAGNLQLEAPHGRAGGDLRLPAEGVVLDELEAELIRQALERTAGNRSRAARLLGLSRDTLLYRMKKYAIT